MGYISWTILIKIITIEFLLSCGQVGNWVVERIGFEHRFKQEIWANAHETRDSISLISYSSYLGLSPVISTKIHFKCASQPQNSEKFTNFGVQGRSRSSMLVPQKARQQCLLWYVASLCICNRSLARLVDSSRNRAFWREYPNLMPSCGGPRQPRESKLIALKSTFNAEHFIRRLSCSILNDFGAIHC